MAEDKFILKLKPEDALCICGFLMEFEPDLVNNHQTKHLRESIAEFKEQVFKMPEKLFEDGAAAVQVKSLIGEAPPMRGNLRIRD